MSHKVAADVSDTSDELSIDMAEKGGDHRRATRGMRVNFKGLTYEVRGWGWGPGRTKLQILRNVSGYLNPSEMTAVLGVSGAGKSTLLDCLAGRKTFGSLQGSIDFDGLKPTKGFLQRYIGYVEQTNSLISELTVAEMLMYTAELKRDPQEPLKAKRDIVERVIADLALQSCRDTRIGSATSRGISGGEAKRTNVGIALVGEPRVLFLDEPTSGLDSYTGGEVMQVVKGLTASGITLMASIHSPTSRTFESFNRVMILQRGRVVYFGASGQAVADYLSKAEVRQMYPNESVAEFVVDVTVKAESQGLTDHFADAYGASALRASNDAELATIAVCGEAGLERTYQELQDGSGTSVPAWRALCILAKYRTARNFTSPAYLFSRMGLYTMISVVLIVVWWQRGGDYTLGGPTNIAGFYSYWVSTPIYGGVAMLPGLVLERTLFQREHADGLFLPATYLTHKISEEVVLAIIASVVLSFPVYGIVGLVGNAVLVWITTLVSFCVTIGVAYLAAALSPNLAVASMAVASYGITITFFLGLFPSWAILPDYVKWYTYLNPMRYAYAALMNNAFQSHPDALIGPFTALEFVGVSGWHKWASVGYESLFFVLLCGATLVSFHFVRYDRR